jgi:hypothetical protein
MPTTIQITTDNYDGQTAVITFTPDNGGPVVNLGSQVLPYDYNAEYVYGTYNLYFPLFDTTCILVIVNQTQTPTPTPTVTPNQTQTPTPTPSITPTLTPTPTQSNLYYVYRICNNISIQPQYIVQTLPGLTVTPGKIIRNPFDYGFPLGVAWFCWEFLYVANTSPSFPSGTNVTTFTGNYFSLALNIVFDKCSDCLSYVEPPPPLTYVLLGPYATDGLACNAGVQNGLAGLGFTTFSNNNPSVGSQVYTNQILITTPGWYSYSASFIGGGFYNTIYIDNTGTITQTGQSCLVIGPFGP